MPLRLVELHVTQEPNMRMGPQLAVSHTGQLRAQIHRVNENTDQSHTKEQTCDQAECLKG